MRFLPDSSTDPSNHPPLPSVEPPGLVAENTIYPFSLTEVVFLTENKGCEQMVRQWMKHKGNLEKFYNKKSKSIKGQIIQAITSPGDFFELVAQTDQFDAETEYEMILKLDEAYGVEGSEVRYQNIREDEALIKIIVACPLRAMMHLSLRKKPTTSGGHAIGIARSDDTYYIYDPQYGMFRVQGQKRLEEVLANNLAVLPSSKRVGEWANYVYFHNVLVPNALHEAL